MQGKIKLVLKSENTGHPTTVFFKISDRRSKYCLEFSITWGRLKTSRWPFQSCTIFEAHLIKFLKFNFSQFTTQVRLFCVGRKKPKIFGLKNVTKRGIRKILAIVTSSTASKIIGEIILKPLKFRKDWSCPRMTEQMQIL